MQALLATYIAGLAATSVVSWRNRTGDERVLLSIAAQLVWPISLAVALTSGFAADRHE